MRNTYYVKSDKMYAVGSQFEKRKILAAAKRLKKKRKLPTSVVLGRETVSNSNPWRMAWSSLSGSNAHVHH